MGRPSAWYRPPTSALPKFCSASCSRAPDLLRTTILLEPLSDGQGLVRTAWAVRSWRRCNALNAQSLQIRLTAAVMGSPHRKTPDICGIHNPDLIHVRVRLRVRHHYSRTRVRLAPSTAHSSRRLRLRT